MSTKELARLAVIKGAIDGVYTVKQAARKLGISVRWVKRMKKAVREQGDGAVIHGNAGRHPANVTDEAIQAKIIALKKSGAYEKANFTHFRELLEEREQIRGCYYINLTTKIWSEIFYNSNHHGICSFGY